MSARAWSGSRTLVAVALVAACAHNTVQPGSEARVTGAPAPAKVLVFDLSYRVEGGTPDAEDTAHGEHAALTPEERADRERLGEQVAAAFSTELVEDLRKLGLDAERARRGTRVGANAVAVRGQFIDVDEGSKLKRLVIGFGMGATRIDARIALSRGSSPLMEFETHSDSGDAPGGAVTTGAGVVATGGVSAVGVAGAAATGAVKTHLSRIERLATTNAEQAARFVSEDFARRGWIDADRVQPAKR